MGNSSATLQLKSAIRRDDVDTLRSLVATDSATVRAALRAPLNRRRDASLALALRVGSYDLAPVLLDAGAAVNAANRDGETPVDVLLRTILPGDDNILHRHCCLHPPPPPPPPPYHDPASSSSTSSSCNGGNGGDAGGGDSFVIPEVLRLLLRRGAKGQSLQRLVLHAMKDGHVVLELCELISDLDAPEHYRLAGLLLQVAVWFDLDDCLRRLLVRGVDALNFWRSTFVPTLVPNRGYRSPVWPRGDSGEYVLPPGGHVGAGGGGASPPSAADNYAIQTLKLSFVQDWRAEWDDGGNPSAQYRAGLHLTPDSATLFARSAHRYAALAHVMRDVLHFLPCSCSGPRLNDSDLVGTLALAGYRFSDDEIVHLQLKFDVDFKRYLRYCAEPAPLRHLARTTLRFAMPRNVYCSLDRMPGVPTSLKNFILIQDGDIFL